MSGHTPGPWYAWDNGDGLIGVGKNYGDQADLFRASRSTGRPSKEDDCNMRLAAAAPDLLVALEIAAETFRRYEQSHRAKGSEDGLNKAIANQALAISMEQIIARSKGEQP